MAPSKSSSRKTKKRTQSPAVSKITKEKSLEKARGQHAFVLLLSTSRGASASIDVPKKPSKCGISVVDQHEIKWPLNGGFHIQRTELEKQMRDYVENYIEGRHGYKKQSEITRTLRKNVNDYINNACITFMKQNCPDIKFSTGLGKKCDGQKSKDQNIFLKQITIPLTCYPQTVTLSEEQITACGKMWLEKNCEKVLNSRKVSKVFKIEDSVKEIEDLFLEYSQKDVTESTFMEMESKVQSMLHEEIKEEPMEMKEEKVTLPSVDSFLKEPQYDMTEVVIQTAPEQMIDVNNQEQQEMEQFPMNDSFFQQGDIYEETMNTTFPLITNVGQEQQQYQYQMPSGFYTDNVTGMTWFIDAVGNMFMCNLETIQWQAPEQPETK